MQCILIGYIHTCSTYVVILNMHHMLIHTCTCTCTHEARTHVLCKDWQLDLYTLIIYIVPYNYRILYVAACGQVYMYMYMPYVCIHNHHYTASASTHTSAARSSLQENLPPKTALYCSPQRKNAHALPLCRMRIKCTVNHKDSKKYKQEHASQDADGRFANLCNIV